MKRVAVDLLVMHHAVPENVDAGLNSLHATPSQIGERAASARVKFLVLSHHMERALQDASHGEGMIRESYKNRLSFAQDLDCYCLE